MELKNYSYTYQHETSAALNQLNYQVHPHAVNFVIGPNGSGKSTLIDALTLNTRFGQISGQVIGPDHDDYLYVTQMLPMLGAVRCSEIAKFILGNIFLTSHIALDHLAGCFEKCVHLSQSRLAQKV
ncbi:ATP-binding protein [Levilactobacillus enshiensis]|uniref:ATP-binding protein n=1 Tax=Levilactobacillus enshiensis TaxID=2590213 RepID=UPI00117A587F|nr:AAA family ATPase [Levilactobacillus enshiensis]